MDFFEHQEVARKSTQNLLFLFLLAVAAIVGTVYLVLVIAFRSASGMPVTLWEPNVLLWTACGVTTVIVLGSLWKSQQLRGGGAVVARHLGGRPVDPGTHDLLERRVLNVVQEMAIASGTPVPEVYLLEAEAGINAFAAGHTPEDAVIGVTRGAMEKLSRDELQGVMAHEFSHVLNGDMRLNLRLMGVIHGILMIALIGRLLMHGGRGGRRRDGGGQAALVGLALFLVGYIGVFFGNLIKAAVSRQREFLADASAVQFTRDPRGIAGALMKIGGLSSGSRVRSSQAEEASHMFFGDFKLHALTTAMATHPPLPERIRRIDPTFTGTIASVADDYVATPDAGAPMAAAMVGAAALSGLAAGAAVGPGSGVGAETGPKRPARPRPNGSTVLERIGRPGPEHLERARALWASIPEPLREASRRKDDAVALAYALLIAPPGAERERQLALVRREDPPAAEPLGALIDASVGLEPDARLPLLEVLGATLGALTPERFAVFGRTLRALVEGDRRLDLPEWLLSRLLLRHLRKRMEPSEPRKPHYRSIGAFANEAETLLSALAHAGHDDVEGATLAFSAAVAEVGLEGARLRDPDACPPRALEGALETFALLFPEAKRRLITACAASVAADERVHPREAELFRVVSDWLGVPVPPLLPGQLFD